MKGRRQLRANELQSAGDVGRESERFTRERQPLKTPDHLNGSEQRLSLGQEKHLCHGRAPGSTVVLFDSFQGGPIAAAGADEVEIIKLGILSEKE